MSLDIHRQPNESHEDWTYRLILAKVNGETDLDWSEIRDILGLECHHDTLRKEASGIKKYHEYIQKKNTPPSLLDEYEIKKLELQKERVKLQSEKSEINKWVREQARSELFYEKIIQAIEKQKPIRVPNYRIEYKQTKRDLVTPIADAHYGKEVKIIGLENEILNEYNIEIFERRMWDLLNQIIHILDKENLRHVTLFDLSDSIEGILRMSQLQSLQLGITDSVIGYGTFMATWLNELSHYAFVDVYECEGNHNEVRVLNANRGEFPHENTQKLISWYLQGVLKDNPNVKIHGARHLWYVDVLGTKILATHGQDEKNLNRSIQDYEFLYNKPIDILLTGHLHFDNTKTIGKRDMKNIQVIQSPSICGIDNYSMQLKKASNAGATVMVFEEGYGKRITYDIILK